MKAVGGLIQTDGLKWSADLRREIGRRVCEVRVGDHPLDPARRHTVVSHAGMLRGLHRYETLTQGESVRRQDRSVADLVEAAFRKAGTVRAPRTW